MSALLRCNVCPGEPFRAPNDEVGTALMWAHLRAEHAIACPDEAVIAPGSMRLRPARPDDYTWAATEGSRAS